MNNLLHQIIAKKREELNVKKRLVPILELKQQIIKRKESELFHKAITQAVNNPAIIAEVKFNSPSAGKMGSPDDLIKLVKLYEEAGADAISVITEPHYFWGNIDFIGRVKQAVGLPVLQKDFVIDEYQIYEAAVMGSDALLLIARLIDGNTLSNFVKLAGSLEVEPIVEIYSPEDLEKAVGTDTGFIAVNARNLDTLEINLKNAGNLLEQLPANFIRLGFSGIKSSVEVEQYKKSGARGILIGTSLMKANDIKGFIDNLK